MKCFKFIMFLFGTLIIMSFSCREEKELECSTGKILEITCGGVVIQFLNTDQIIGEKWNDNFSSPVLNYDNCVLVGNLPLETYEKSDTIYFDYEKVDDFSNSNFCDIGGLPRTRILISKLSAEYAE
jgi:hypothetical protein